MISQHIKTKQLRISNAQYANPINILIQSTYTAETEQLPK